MHACGHDTHMTAWIGDARRLAATKDKWSGTLVMIGQPGEETGEGAIAMLDDGLFTRFPKPDYVIAFHDAAVLPAGVIGLTPGYALANVDSVDIIVRGVGGHGAVPQNTRDPIVLAARIVGSLQTLVSREIDPQSPAVVTVGSFHSGAKHNIISDEAKLQLTVRSYTPETRKLLLDGIRRHRAGRSDRRGDARRQDADRHHPRGRIYARDLQHRGADQPRPRFVHRAFRRRPDRLAQAGDGRRGFQPLLARRQEQGEPVDLGRRHAQGSMGQGRRAMPASCRRFTRRSGRPTPKR